VSLKKVQDSTISSLCMGLMDMYITSSKTRAGLLKRYFSGQIVFFGCVLVLHISGSAALTELLHDLLGSVDTPSHYRCEDDRNPRTRIVSAPDSEVVHSLTKRGYNKYAAARATIMSGNQDYRAAQEWAIAHTLQTKSNQPFLSIQSSRKAGGADEPIQTLRNVLKMLESAGGAAEFLLLPNSQACSSTAIQSKPRNLMRKQAMNESKSMGSRVGGKAQNSRNFHSASTRHHESSDTELSAHDSHPKNVRKENNKQSILQVERPDCQQPFASEALLSDRSPSASLAPETRKHQVSERVSSRVGGSTRDIARDRLIEEGRLLLQKTMRKKRSAASATTRSAQ